MKYIFIINPIAGNDDKAKIFSRIKSTFRMSNDEMIVESTHEQGDAQLIAKKYAKEYGSECVIVSCGGDGTVHEIANGLAGTDTPLLLLPLGTGNDFAKKVYGTKNINVENVIKAFGFYNGKINYDVKPIDLIDYNGEKCINVMSYGLDTKVETIGRKIAEDLNIKFYNRELVDEIIEEVGIPKEIMEKVEEGGTIAGKGAEGDVRGSFSKYADLTDRAIHVQKQIIRKLAEKESCVIIGRSADYILKDSDKINLLRAFIYAPDDVRIHNIMESHNLTEKDARILLLEKDKRYHKRHLALTGSNRGDRHNRNILIDSSYLGIEGTADYIEELVRRKFGSGEE